MGRRDQEKTRRSQQRADKKGEKQIADPEEEYSRAPHTFVINRGAVGKNVSRLVRDMRRVMEPFTASQLKTTKKNVLKDFVSVAGVLNVTHMMLFSKTETGTNLRVVRSPRGPTLTFHVDHYSLSADVVSSLKRPAMEARQFQHHPLLVMNNFSGEGKEMNLMATMFQNMFPSINVNKVKLNTIRRCVLLNYNSEDKTVEFRHYNIKAVPVGMSRGVKKLIKAKVPNLDRYDDVSELLLRGGELSESEAELDGPHNEVILPQDVGSRGNIKSAKSAIRLTEIGPRLTLKLVKIEEGVCGGEVLFHQYRSLTEEDLKYMKAKREMKKDAKDQRKQTQAENVKKKAAEKERLKQLALDGMKKKAEAVKEEKSGSESDDEVEEPETQEVYSGDDDVAYYKQEVGEAPDPDMQLSRGERGGKRKWNDRPRLPFKKKKPNNDNSQTDKDDRTGKFAKRFNKGDKFSKDGGQKGKKGDRFDKFDTAGTFDRKGKFGKKGHFDNKSSGSRGRGGNSSRGRGGGGRGRGAGGRGRGAGGRGRGASGGRGRGRR